MSQSFFYPPAGTNASVSATGAVVPVQATLVGGKDAGGLLRALSVDSSGVLNVNIVSLLPNPLPTTDAADGPSAPGAASAKSTLIGIQYNSSLPTLTTGQQAAAQADSSGRILVGSIFSPLPAGTNVLGAVTQSGSWSILDITGTVSLPTGASTSALQTQISGQLPATLGAHVISASLAVNIASDQVVPISATALPLPSGASTSAHQVTMLARVAGSLTPVTHDQVTQTYVPSGNGAGQVATAVYKLATVTVKTLTFTYDSSDRLTDVVAT